MNKKLFLIAVLVAFNSAWARSNAPADLRFEVRSSQSFFEPFDYNRPVEIFVRSAAPGYLTIYQIHPDSGFAILYPQPHHHWRELDAKKEYELSDLAQDLVLEYRGLDGFVYLGMVMTKEPVYLVPWLEQIFGENGLKAGMPPLNFLDENFEALIEKVEDDIRFRLGKADLCSFALIPLLIKSYAQIHTADWYETPHALRYFYDGKYHYVEPDSPSRFPGALLQGPRPFPRRGSISAGKAILPATGKTEPSSKKSSRREKKN